MARPQLGAHRTLRPALGPSRGGVGNASATASTLELPRGTRHRRGLVGGGIRGPYARDEAWESGSPWLKAAQGQRAVL